MTTEKKAHVFVFTDWHLQQGVKPGDWPPFGQSNPPDNRTLCQLVEEIHQARDSFLTTEFLPEERMQFVPVEVGAEQIFQRGEPEWKVVWGVIVDPSAVSTAGNDKKLRKMGLGVQTAMKERSGRPILFLTPVNTGKTPQPLASFEKFFIVFNVADPSRFIMVAGAELAQASQQIDPVVARFIERQY